MTKLTGQRAVLGTPAFEEVEALSESKPNLARAIEELRQRLHEALGEGYDPVKLQKISSQLDSLIVEATRKLADERQEPER